MIEYITRLLRMTILLFFFFQAEDGIRDLTVTGVQTCALPISTDAFGGGKKRAEMSAHFRPPGRCQWRRVAENAERAWTATVMPSGAPFFAALRTYRSMPKAA